MTDVEEKRRRGRQILFDRDSPCLWALSGLDRRRLILWAFACAEEATAEFDAPLLAPRSRAPGRR